MRSEMGGESVQAGSRPITAIAITRMERTIPTFAKIAATAIDSSLATAKLSCRTSSTSATVDSVSWPLTKIELSEWKSISQKGDMMQAKSANPNAHRTYLILLCTVPRHAFRAAPFGAFQYGRARGGYRIAG
jgi:hypothetical protein